MQTKSSLNRAIRTTTSPVKIVATAVASCCGLTAGTATADLISYWNFNEPVGTLNRDVNDLVGTNHGTFTTTAVPTQITSTAGVSATGYGNAYDFAGSTAKVDLGDTASLDFGTNDFTIAGWFQAPSDSLNTHRFIFNNSVHDQSGIQVLIMRSGLDGFGGKINFGVKGSSGGNREVYTNAPVWDNNWHWFAGVVENGTMSLYLDGVKQVDTKTYAATTNATPPSGTPTEIGVSWTGVLDDIVVFDTALGATLSGTNLTGGDLHALWQQGTSSLGGFAPIYAVPEPRGIAILGGAAAVGLLLRWRATRR